MSEDFDAMKERLDKANASFSAAVNAYEKHKVTMKVANAALMKADQAFDASPSKEAAAAVVVALRTQSSILSKAQDLSSDVTFALGEIAVAVRKYSDWIARENGLIR